MSYPGQLPVLQRLERESRSVLRRREDHGAKILQEVWSGAKDALRGAIATEVMRDAGGGRLMLAQARRRGTFLRLERRVANILRPLNDELGRGIAYMAQAARLERCRRTVWMLDQVLPPNVPLYMGGRRLRRAPRIRESQAPVGPMISGQVGTGTQPWDGVSVDERIATWLEAWKSNLLHNIQLGAMNDAQTADLAAEVDATRAGSPALDMWNVLDRIYRTAYIAQASAGYDDAIGEQRQAPIVEVWWTSHDTRVCPDCEALDGVPREDAGAEPPLHPYCRCEWRFEPLPWADLAGQPAPNGDRRAMVFYDQQGRAQASIVVDFERWNPQTE